MNKVALILLGLITSIELFSQAESYPLASYGTTPASPEASALAKYAQIPINHSTGIPSINYPIVGLSGFTKEMQVSISYHASGNRVADYATWVGLGWALNAGGVITRQVNGRADEIPQQTGPGYNDLDNGNFGDGLWGIPNGGYLEHNDAIPVSFDPSNSTHQNLARRTVHGLLDLQPDEFYFNFMGRGGMFVFDNNGAPRTIPYQNIKIEVIDDFEGFVITDEMGYKYTFEQMEFTNSSNSCGNNFAQQSNAENCSGWYMTKVENVNGQIEFEIEYEENEDPSHTHSFYETRVDYWGDNCPSGVSESCVVTHTQYIQHIKKISSSNGYILFNKGVEREDLFQDYVLESVEYFNSQDQLISKVKLQHSYFIGISDVKRLRLDGFYYQNNLGEQLQPTVFEYNDEKLPPYNSKSVDHWGYYNGSNNNSLIPEGPLSALDYNREPHKDFVKAGIIEQAISPTGAKQYFYFESNEFGRINEQLVNFSNQPSLLAARAETQFVNQQSTSFTILHEKQFSVNYSFFLDYNCYGPCFVRVKDSNDVEYLYAFTSSSTQETGTANITLPPGTYTIIADRGGNCSDWYGNYATNTGYAKIELFSTLELGSNSKSKYGGGLRIGRLSVDDGSNINPISTSYEYSNFNESDRSSGILITQPDYSYTIGTGYIVEDLDGAGFCQPGSSFSYHHECDVARKFSFSVYQLGTAQGGYVMYNQVTEVVSCNNPGNCENGRIEYEFNYEANGLSDNVIQQRPYSPEWKRGNLIAQRVYSSENKILKSSLLDYNSIGSNGDPVRGMKANDLITTIHNQNGGNYELWCGVEYTMKAAVYSYISDRYVLASRTDKVFDQNDDSKFTTNLTEYTYDNSLKLIETKITNLESGESTKQRTAYVTSYYPGCSNCENGQSEAIDFMFDSDKRMWAQPIERIDLKKIGSQYYVIGGQLNEFDIDNNGKLVSRCIWNLEPEIPILESSFAWSTIASNGTFVKSNDYRKIGEFIFHDQNLRPIASQNENDIPTTVIRDYFDGRVVAEIQNASPPQCAYSSFETSDGNGWNYDLDDCYIGILTHLGFDFSIGYTGHKYYEFHGVPILSNSMPAGQYKLTFWAVSTGSIAVAASGGATVTTNFSNVDDGPPYWKYHEYSISATNSFVVTISGGEGIRLDELRLHPKDALMSSSTYNSDGTVISTCSPNNRTQRFFYDSWKRLIWTLDDNWEILSHVEYHVKNQNDVNDHGWIKESAVMLEGMTKNEVLNASANDEEVLSTVTYTDALGRTLQSFAIRQSPHQFKDLVTFHQYDELGRESKSYLPFASGLFNDGEYLADPVAKVLDFYDGTPRVVNTSYPYSETEYEASPMSRVLKQGSAGEQWQLNTTHTLKSKHLLNNNNEVLLWKVQASGASAMLGMTAQFHPANSLFKKEIEDEHGVKTWEFTNALGQVVCRRARVWMTGSGTGSYSWNHGRGQIGDETIAYLPGQEQTWRFHDSYFVYDDFGRLLYEIPAIATLAFGTNYTFSTISGGTNYSIFDGYMSASKYDSRGRTIEDKKPGQGWSQYVYNVLNQMIFSQSPEQSPSNVWNFVKFDQLGRPIQTGLMTSPESRSYLQSQYGDLEINLWEVKSGDPSSPYSNEVFPTTYDHLLTETYYDDYLFETNGYVYDLNGTPIVAQGRRTMGAITGQKILILDEGMTDYLLSVSYFDTQGRLSVQFVSNMLHGHDKITTEYDFIGKVTQSTRQFFKDGDPANELTIVNRFEYDHAGRPLKTYQKIGADQEVILSKLVYNEIGQVVKKHLHLTDETNIGMQVIDYRYNERGWLTKINNADLVDDGDNSESWDVFGEELIYHEQDRFHSSIMQMKSQYNGNIAAVKWKTNRTPDLGGDELGGHSYVFRYDKLGQMTGAYYAASSDTYIDNYSYRTHMWDETAAYDPNGNILSMNRKRGADDTGTPFASPMNMDQLSYSYLQHSNKLNKIVDYGQTAWVANERYTHFVGNYPDGNQYSYDTEGRITEDFNKGLSFEYNHLDLVKTVSDGNEDVLFTWDATGQKLAKTISGSTTYYLGGIEYQDNTLTHIATNEGIARSLDGGLNNGDWVYDYYLKDHLGNVRAVITEENSQILTEKVTVELHKRLIEDANFDNVSATEQTKPYLYPYDPDDPESQKVSELSSFTGKIIGPAKVMAVKQGEKIDLSTKYWYTEAPGDPLTSIAEILAGTLINLGAASSGIIPEGPETGMALLNNISGDQFGSFSNFINDAFQDVDFSRPQAYIVYMYFDNKMNLDVRSSGIIQVAEANALGMLSKTNIIPRTDGFFYTYVTNRSEGKVHFDNMVITRWAPQVRVTYDYYPYGLTWENPAIPSDPNAVHDHCYQDKEFQFSEFATGHGLALYDFHARMYDPAMGRWMVPDPESQFNNPYLAMGNNPAIGVDPDGKFVQAIIIGAAVGAIMSGAMYAANSSATGDFTWRGLGRSMAMGAVAGAIGGVVAQAGIAMGASAHSLGLNIISNSAAQIGTAVAYGQEVNAGTIAGGIVGGIIGTGIGNFQGVSGSSVLNISSEIAYNMAKFGVSGAGSGMVNSLINKGDIGDGFYYGMMNGAIGGATISAMNILAFGAAYKINKNYSDLGKNNPTYRKGHFLYRKGDGLTIGRNIVTRLKGNADYDEYLRSHEKGHYLQEIGLGFGRMYARTLKEYFIDPGFSKAYTTYTTLEWGAEMNAFQELGYYYDADYNRLDVTNFNSFRPGAPLSLY